MYLPIYLKGDLLGTKQSNTLLSTLPVPRWET